MLLSPGALQNLELLARQVVEGFIIGLHKSPFHGFSAEFAEHRLYNSGDPLRHVDWKVYGRTDKLFLKRFEEETNLRCCIALDISASMHFPQESGRLSKYQFSAVAAAALFQLLRRQLDAGGLAFFGAGVESLSPVRSSPRHYQQLTLELQRTLSQPWAGGGTALADSLHELAERLHQRSLVIIFTDGLEGQGDLAGVQAALQHLRFRKHEVILFQVLDGQRERRFDFENRPLEFEDAETGERVRVQPQQVREQYLRSLHAFEKEMRDYCLANRIDLVEVDLEAPVEAVLRAFLARRARLM